MAEKKERKARSGMLEQEKSVAASKAIGSGLKALYEQVAREEVPARFIDLLGRLDKTKPSSDK